MANAVLEGDTGDLLKYIYLIFWPHFREAWGKSYVIELGYLAQVMPVWVDGTNVIVFIHNQAIPSNQLKDVTYGQIF